ncbi:MULTISPECIES: 3-isopropylmalate dehydratase large subunit [unclassified Sphingomonas]|uniref:3-isopropylmalate dehydratase large subunit n=1 Tax=unclassified Sphingomonas TaxID=196159 RepID=UPI001F173602|nr:MULTISPECIES: 3-isopropylmalate dehydratase large subunit [unclassified Sphingomonas]
MFDKIWAEHRIADLGGGLTLLNVDRHLIHDLVAGPAFDRLAARGLPVRNPERTFATPDHGVTSQPDRPARLDKVATKLLDDMRHHSRKAGVQLFDIGQDGQGIVHVVGPELGLTLPGSLIVCGDSHSCTHGGLGALSFGIGTTEVVHVLATQTIRQRKPKAMRITYTGEPGRAVTAKDIILFTIAKLGTKAGTGHAVEYAGPAIAALDIEERLTLCNLSIELGSKIGMIAPDDRSFAYLAGKAFAPKGALFDAAVAHWRTLTTDEGARFHIEHHIDIGEITPQVSWGTSPEDVIAIDGHVPDPDIETDPARRQRMIEALDYMGLTAGQPLAGVPIDRVFIGSCANGRLSDLRAAARIAARGTVAANVQAWVVPGSRRVQQAAEAEGLDRIFRDAGFEWREPGCSLCLSTANEQLLPGERSVSTTNRNFVGRQGLGARTHLASPATAAASALAGTICDVRALEGRA